jgi:NADH-quinone oxidoreductase subunit C
MDKTQLGEFVRSLDPDIEVVDGKQYPEVNVPPEKLFELAKKLKENKETLFDYLICITGVDWGSDLGVTYHITSSKYGHTIVLKVRTADRENPEFDSVYDIWKTAELHEREAYDLLGIRFRNHPDLRRLFLDSSWGFPLRKDYTDDINIVTK